MPGSFVFGDLSGIILIDFINLEKEEDKKELLQNLQGYLKQDPVKGTVVDMTPLNIVEVTRKESTEVLTGRTKCPGKIGGYGMREKSPLTTLCYIEKEEQYLMLHRVSKKQDINKDKWIGVGGHFEQDESPEECLLREVKEETGLTLTSYRFRGIVTFYFSKGDGSFSGTEYMCRIPLMDTREL